MNILRYYSIIIVTLTLFVSCVSSNSSSKASPHISTENINTTFNNEYKRHIKKYDGKIESKEYKIIRKKIEQELPYQISPKDAILIHFRQKANNCISLRENGSHFLKNQKFDLKMSSKVSRSQDVSDFFVFTKDAYLLDHVTMKTNIIMDSGFFSDNIFTEREMCSGFIIIKPNGEFLKYYGEDYYTVIKEFLNID